MLLALKPEHAADGDILMTPGLWIGYAALYLAMVLTLWSMMRYLRAAAPQFLAAGKGD